MISGIKNGTIMKDAKISLWLPGNEPPRNGVNRGQGSSRRNSARGDRVSARGDRSDRSNRGRAGTNTDVDLGVVGSGMSVGGSNSRRGSNNAGGGGDRRDAGYVPSEHSRSDRRPVSLRSGSANDDAEGGSSSVVGIRGSRSNTNSKNEYWPTKERQQQQQQQEGNRRNAGNDVSASADNIRAKLQTLKRGQNHGPRRGGPRVSRRAASASQRQTLPPEMIDTKMLEAPRPTALSRHRN